MLSHRPLSQKHSAMTESFLRFHLARKSITLLFFTTMSAIRHRAKSQLALRTTVQRYKKNMNNKHKTLSILLVHFVHFAFGTKNIDGMVDFLSLGFSRFSSLF